MKDSSGDINFTFEEDDSKPMFDMFEQWVKTTLDNTVGKPKTDGLINNTKSVIENQVEMMASAQSSDFGIQQQCCRAYTENNRKNY